MPRPHVRRVVAGLVLFLALWWIGPAHDFSGPVVLSFHHNRGLHLADIVGLELIAVAAAIAFQWRVTWWRVVAASVGGLAAWMALAMITLIVAAPVSHAGHVNAMVVMPGDGARLAGTVMALVEHGYAPVVVIPRPRDSRDPVDRLCDTDPGFAVICPVASSPSVRDRARAAAGTIRGHAWRQVALVTARSHSTVAKALLQRCIRVAVAVIGEPAHEAFPRVFVTEWARLLASEWSRRC